MTLIAAQTVGWSKSTKRNVKVSDICSIINSETSEL